MRRARKPRATRRRPVLTRNKDPPFSRAVAPPSAGRVVATPQVGDLHHRYERVASRSLTSLRHWVHVGIVGREDLLQRESSFLPADVGGAVWGRR
jgi:hypothetical protein